MFTLTIYFIALYVYVEFVLIYRPHPVLWTVYGVLSILYFSLWYFLFIIQIESYDCPDAYIFSMEQLYQTRFGKLGHSLR